MLLRKRVFHEESLIPACHAAMLDGFLLFFAALSVSRAAAPPSLPEFRRCRMPIAPRY